jgi:hypothetical protein
MLNLFSFVGFVGCTSLYRRMSVAGLCGLMECRGMLGVGLMLLRFTTAEEQNVEGNEDTSLFFLSSHLPLPLVTLVQRIPHWVVTKGGCQ